MKKSTKKVLITILTLIILIINTNFAFAVEFVSPGIEFETPQFFDAASSTLDLSVYFNTDEFVDYMVEQLKVVDGTSSTIAIIDISKFNIPKNDSVKKALQELIWYNSPELFRIADMGLAHNGAYYTNLHFYSHYTKEEYAGMHSQMINEAEKLLIGVKDNPNLTDVEKTLILHDRLALHCEYDNDTFESDYENMPQSSYNAYGVLVLRDAVCMGYALAYDYLLEQVGIQSDYCSSDELNHAWNIVYINNTPYHVDVTWDDPVWDVSGRVRHENFLRSTNGFIETGHIEDGKSTIDYNNTPTDTTYDNYFWQSYETAFQLLNNEIYCFNSTDKNIELLKSEDGSEIEVIKNLPYKWRQGEYATFIKSFSKLLCDGEFLYYNTPDTVMKFDPVTQNEEEIFKPDLTNYNDYFWIYGLNIKNDKIICEIYSSPDFDGSVKSNYTQTCELYQMILPTDKNSIIDKESNIIFSENIVCKNIEEICKISDDITYTVVASNSSVTAEYLGTGSIITLYKNDEKIAEYTIVIDGDLDGDSVCDGLDVALAEMATTNARTPSAIECYAANGVAREVIDISAFQNVVNTALDIS